MKKFFTYVRTLHLYVRKFYTYVRTFHLYVRKFLTYMRRFLTYVRAAGAHVKLRGVRADKAVV